MNQVLFSDPYCGMFQDVMKALLKKVGKRTNLMPWLAEHETFLRDKIDKGQEMISEAYKDRENITLEEFGHIIKNNFWDQIKEGIKRYDANKKQGGRK